ncbi:MFS transporter [Streptomyces nogalater]
MFLGVFLAAHVVGALTSDFSVLLATRVVAALANAGFLAVGLTAATGMVAPDAKGRATAVLLGGTTLACVAGVAGRRPGPHAGLALGVLGGGPGVRPGTGGDRPVGAARPGGRGPVPGASAELRALRLPRLLSVLCLAALVNGATFCTFTYLAPLVTEVCGLGAGWVPGVLALFGAGAFAGVTAAGRLADRPADRRARPVLPSPAPRCWPGGPRWPWPPDGPAWPSPWCRSSACWPSGSAPRWSPGCCTRRPTRRPRRAFATSALNVGATLGPVLGGAALDGGFGHRSPVWVSALLMAMAGLVARRRTRRSEQPL